MSVYLRAMVARESLLTVEQERWIRLGSVECFHRAYAFGIWHASLAKIWEQNVLVLRVNEALSSICVHLSTHIKRTISGPILVAVAIV